MDCVPSMLYFTVPELATVIQRDKQWGGEGSDWARQGARLFPRGYAILP